MRKLNFYIAGHWVNPITATRTLDVIDPTTEEAVANLFMGDVDDAEAAVQAAFNIFDQWSQTSLKERIVLVEKFLLEYESRYEEMALAISTEMGAPIDMSRNVQTAVGLNHTRADLAAIAAMELEERNGKFSHVVREPIGVCVLITPWNWPVGQIACKVIPALLAGCTVVLKPSELTPLSAQLYAECIDAVGFPPGVFNMIHGEGITIGPHLTSHPLVDMVSFTGSTRAGIQIAKSAADTVKRVTQELGGKSPNIIFADANLEMAVRQGVLTCMFNTGQICDAPTRMLVQRSVYQQAKDIAQATAQAIRLGDPKQSGDHLGPVISQLQWDKIQYSIQQGIDEGAQLLAGGIGKPEGLETGYYIKPTVFADANNQMKIAREEVFGPVLVMMPFDTEAEAITIANDTVYGLGAYLSTADLERGRRVARRLKSGTVHINSAEQEYSTPFGGYKQSGNGREYGVFGIHEFQEIKGISGYYLE